MQPFQLYIKQKNLIAVTIKPTMECISNEPLTADTGKIITATYTVFMGRAPRKHMPSALMGYCVRDINTYYAGHEKIRYLRPRT